MKEVLRGALQAPSIIKVLVPFVGTTSSQQLNLLDTH
jgi:hypothetical protein